MKVTVLGSRELVFGFRLAGVDGLEVEPCKSTVELFRETAADPDVAIIVLGQSLFKYLKEEVHKVRIAGPLPSVISLPELTDKGEPHDANALIAEFLGLSI